MTNTILLFLIQCWQALSGSVGSVIHTVDELVESLFHLVPAAGFSKESIFNFSNFISSIALASIIVSLADLRYKHRLRITILPLVRMSLTKVTYLIFVFIGILLLWSDIEFARANVPPLPWVLHEQIFIQGFCGTLFFLTLILWAHYLRNPVAFNKLNYLEYYQSINEVIIKGDGHELSIMAEELKRSSASIIKNSITVTEYKSHRADGLEVAEMSKCAFNLLLLIGSKTFCKYLVDYSPTTAIQFFRDMSAQEKFDLPLQDFSRNITSEAIHNKDSIIYAELFSGSGLLGYQKLFTSSVYANYALVEKMDGRGLLDVEPEEYLSWDLKQFEAYVQIVQIFGLSYIASGATKSASLSHALNKIEKAFQGHQLWNLSKPEYHAQKIHKKLTIVTHFIKELLAQNPHESCDIYDKLANLSYKIMLNASNCKNPDICFIVQHNDLWAPLIEETQNEIFQQKIFALLDHKISSLNDNPMHGNTSVLGYCLNVMGVVPDKNKSYHALHKKVISLTQKYFLELTKSKPEIAKNCIIGNIEFDKKENRIYKKSGPGKPRVANEFIQLKTA